MAVESDLSRWDVFQDPLWLLHNLFNKYKVIRVPTNAAWVPSIVPTGGTAQYPFHLYPFTGVGVNSRGLLWTLAYGLNSGDMHFGNCDFSKRLELHFTVWREGSDVEAVARFQLKQVNTEGDLAAVGLGLRINNLTVLGEAFGTARQTLALGTLTILRLWNVKIVHIPNNRVEFWVNNVLVGSLTGTAVPTGAMFPSYLVASIINGATGGVNDYIYISNILVIQQR